MAREVAWRRVMAIGLLLVSGAPFGASAQALAVNPEEAYQAESVFRIEGGASWGAVLISEGRELLVAEQQVERVTTPSRSYNIHTGGLSFSIREAATGKELRRLAPRGLHRMPAWGISADGTRLALGVAESGENILIVIDTSTDREVRRFAIPGNPPLEAVAISPDARRVAAVSEAVPTMIYVWDAESGGVIQQFRLTGAPTIASVAFSADGARVLTSGSLVEGLFGGGMEAIAEVWDVAGGRRIAEAKVKDAGFNAAIFSPDGKHFLTANRGAAEAPSQVGAAATLWDAMTGKQVMAIGVGVGPVTGLSFTADGARIATASVDRRARVWDAATGGLIAVLTAHSALDNRFTYRGPNGSSYQPDQESVRFVSPVFSREGTSLVTSGLDGVVQIWVDAVEKHVADKAAFTADLSAAQSGELEAMYRLSSAYRDGRGVERNGVVAAQWLTQAADGGHGPANLELANVLLWGDGGRQDCVAGGERLNRSIASGSADAGTQLDVVLAPLGGRQGAAALAPQIQADLLEAQIIEVLTRQEYPAFLANLCALEALGHADRLPVEARRELIYHRAAGLRAAGKPRAALAALNQYLNEAGNAGASYTQAIQMLRPLQEEAK
jgi:TPR repeat protein